ncbi:extracellular calcium-sensing receptor-like [Dendrobates tinctorius]|uniref:extracellular calcium-sensing receptor-like n=1 Tax=Dendrobates tinctorius TaxID=92724 RepID=UPI003CC94175
MGRSLDSLGPGSVQVPTARSSSLHMYQQLITMPLRINIYSTVWYLILSAQVVYSSSSSCRLRISSLSGIFQKGDIVIGAVIPFHTDRILPKLTFIEAPSPDTCTMFFLESFQQYQAIRFALEEINGSLGLLRNITLGYHALDSCSILPRELEGTLWMISGNNQAVPNYRCQEKPTLAAVLGHSMSTYSILMAHVLGIYRYPQISHFSTSALLSNRAMFPSFFRTVPSDDFQSKGLAQLLIHFGWTWVGLVGVGNDYGQQGIQVIKQEIFRSGACVAFTEFLLLDEDDKNAPHITKVIKESTATAVVLFSTDIYLNPLIDEMVKQKVTGKVFVASEAWCISTILLDNKYSTLLSGSIGFAFHSSTIPGFNDYLGKVDPLNSPTGIVAKIFWENVFGCKFIESSDYTLDTKLCTGNESLLAVDNAYTDASNLRSSFNIYTSVYMIAQSLHELQMCQHGKGPFQSGQCADILNFKPWQLTRYIQNVHVKLSNGREVFFDRNGDVPAMYDIVNWQLGSDGVMKHVKVGSYDTAATDGKVFNIDASGIVWPSGNHQVPTSVCSQSCPLGSRKVIIEGKPSCCFQCVPCPQGEISNQTNSIDCLKCPWNLWPNPGKDQCVPKTTEYLAYEEVLGSTLAAISAISGIIPPSILGLFVHNKSTPIVRANNYTLSCLLLGSLSLCFLCSLVFIGYPKPGTCLMRQAVFGMTFALCVSCMLAKTIMVVFAFMATKPGSSLRKWTKPQVSYIIVFICSLMQFILCASWICLALPFPKMDINTYPGIIIIECNENSPIAFWCMLGYLGLLATISFMVAFIARRLPDSFNEAKFITFSMLAFLSVWISFIPASLSARGKYRVAMEIFAILTSSWALVICMFLPKCYIILFRPDMNSRDHLTVGKNKGWT